MTVCMGDSGERCGRAPGSERNPRYFQFLGDWRFDHEKEAHSKDFFTCKTERGDFSAAPPIVSIGDNTGVIGSAQYHSSWTQAQNSLESFAGGMLFLSLGRTFMRHK